MTEKVSLTHDNEEEHRRKLALAVNSILDGYINSIGTVTLTASSATTTVTDRRVGNGSGIVLVPLTANAGTEFGAGTWYVSARTAGASFQLTHANNAQTDRDFVYIIVGQ